MQCLVYYVYSEINPLEFNGAYSQGSEYRIAAAMQRQDFLTPGI